MKLAKLNIEGHKYFRQFNNNMPRYLTEYSYIILLKVDYIMPLYLDTLYKTIFLMCTRISLQFNAKSH